MKSFCGIIFLKSFISRIQAHEKVRVLEIQEYNNHIVIQRYNGELWWISKSDGATSIKDFVGQGYFS